jgi:hypothetical protein
MVKKTGDLFRLRGCFERGTLNADRKANRKGAALFNGPSSWRGLQKSAQNT